MPKEIDQPNVSQGRPVEILWVYLTQKVYDGGWMTKREQQLICRIESKMKEFHRYFVESLLEGVKVKVRSIGDNGAYALFKYFFLFRN